MINLVGAIFKLEKTVATIFHADWILISIYIVKGKKLTCYHTIKR
ncbi:DJ-1/PfpI family protein [Candidatus Coxiella mudrowiae]|nr:DJ-1/PfpI family protein [Candidatus Coxiella mudrowiae]